MLRSIDSPELATVLHQARSPRLKQITVGEQIVEVPTPFPSPAEWRDQHIYFVFLDRFNNPTQSPLHSPWDGEIGTFQGGTFNGVRDRLDYLRDLGMSALWLSPVLKNCQYSESTYHGYGIQDFLQIDPRFASAPARAEQELSDLVDAAHARGMYVIFDIVLNHAGDVFAYRLDDGTHASEADWRPTPYPICWRDEHGHARSAWSTAPKDPPADAAVWPTELRRNECFRRQGRGGEAGGDFASLKEFVTAFTEVTARDGFHFPVRNALIRAYQYVIARFDVDGFRIDTLKYIEPDFARTFGNAMREFALGIGKKNFFTFGEVYDNEETIAHFIGRQAGDEGDLMGVDAALDFPLFFVLPSTAKGLSSPSAVVNMFEHRKQVERNVLSSHGEASRFFVTFLDNHDQRERFFFSPADQPGQFGDQLTLGVGCLYCLQGIPCLYYGTEQGLHGHGNADLAVREALWGKPNAFDVALPFYKTIRALGRIRAAQPALRYGRQYFRPISGDGIHFGVSALPRGILAFARILNDQELVVVANTSTTEHWTGDVIVDLALNPVGATYEVLFSNKTHSTSPVGPITAPQPVAEKGAGSVEIHEVNGAVSAGPIRVTRVTLQPMEIQILAKSDA